MSTTEVDNTSRGAATGNVGMHLEAGIIPVSDVDRSTQFCQRLGWRLDGDDAPPDGLRIVQFTPPGSGAPVTFGTGLTTAAPGSAEAGLIVSDIVAARDELTGRGIDTSQIWHGPPFPATARQPGRTGTAATAFTSTADLASALRRAQAAHAEHHKRTGRSHLAHQSGHDEDWPAWYAAHLAAEQAGTDLPT